MFIPLTFEFPTHLKGHNLLIINIWGPKIRSTKSVSQTRKLIKGRDRNSSGLPIWGIDRRLVKE